MERLLKGIPAQSMSFLPSMETAIPVSSLVLHFGRTTEDRKLVWPVEPEYKHRQHLNGSSI